jgi:RimJ/RimL family protein N-acetyltransferase
MTDIKIRKASIDDLSEILAIYSGARDFMASVGNPTQWGTSHPNEELLRSDIEEGDLFAVVNDGKVIGVFYYRFGDDPTYKVIYDGEWKNELPYGVIHRIAVAKEARGLGVVGLCFDYCFKLCKNLKIDTHIDNAPMRKALLKSGFEYCGIIHIATGDERIAFQKCEK